MGFAVKTTELLLDRFSDELLQRHPKVGCQDLSLSEGSFIKCDGRFHDPMFAYSRRRQSI